MFLDLRIRGLYFISVSTYGTIYSDHKNLFHIYFKSSNDNDVGIILNLGSTKTHYSYGLTVYLISLFILDEIVDQGLALIW